MRPHPRVRKTIKWASAAATILFLAVWLGSGWWNAVWLGRSHGVAVARGCIQIASGGPFGSTGLLFQRADRSTVGYDWWFHVEHYTPMAILHIPLWLPALPVLLAAGAAWRFDILARRRVRAGLHCAGCGYDLAGLRLPGDCPECGRAAVAARAVSSSG